MKCWLYWKYYGQLIRASEAAQAKQLDPGLDPDYLAALDRMRVHGKVCEDCVGDLQKAFPELAGQKLQMAVLYDLEDNE